MPKRNSLGYKLLLTHRLLKRIWVNDWTKRWSYAQGAGASILAGLSYLNTVTSSEQFKGVLATLTVPWWVPTGIAVLALVTFIAGPK